MGEIIVTHPSTLVRLSACRLQYHWSRLYKPVQSASYLEFGISIHKALEGFYSSGSDPAAVFEAYWLKNNVVLPGDKTLELGITMMTNYKKAYAKESFEVLATELELARRVPVPDDEPEPPTRARRFYIGSIIDAIVLDTSLNQIFVLEHKTFERFYESTLGFNHQFAIEKFVSDGWVQKMNPKKSVVGVIYNGLRKADHHSSTTKLFERHPLYINDHQVKVVTHRIYWQLKATSDPSFIVYPEPDDLKCSMCAFKQPCSSYQRGEDYQFILDNVFTSREDEGEKEWS